MTRRAKFAIAILPVLACAVALRPAFLDLESRTFLNTGPNGPQTPASVGLAFDRLKIHSGRRTLDSYLVRAPATCQPRVAVLIFHGVMETISEWVLAQKYLYDHCISSLVFDYSGHGDSSRPGTISHLNEDAIPAYETFASQFPGERLCVLVHSISALDFCLLTSLLTCYSFPFQGARMSSDLQGRNAVVFGVANKRSIAWSIAQGLHAAGMKLAITYQNERLEQEAKDLILSLPGAEGYMCDVSKDEEISRLFATLRERYGRLHTLVHSVAYAPADELKGEFLNTTREGFRIAMDVSVYSLVAVARAAAPLMEDGGSILTMTYYASEKVVPRYNVMAVAKAGLECSVRYLAYELGKKKIRVNAISAGPIKTLAARGIAGFGDMLKGHEERAPLGRRVEVEEVGSTGVFLASDASSGITGEVIYVDCGYNIMGF